jgi:CRP-like cAMP-binding protein
MCTDHLKYEYFEEGSAICHYGEIGTKFYIILKGSIDCFILRTEEEVHRDFNELTKNKDLNDLLTQNEILQNDIKLIKTKLLNYNQNATEIIKLKKGNTMAFQNPIMDFFKNIHILNPNYYDDCQVLKNWPDFVNLYFYQDFCRFKKIRSMFAGDSFGEVALTLSKPRIASVTARENLHLASLNKEDYNKIFEKQIEEMNQKMRCFLSQFNSFSKDAIIKFTYEFKPVNFTSNQVIFREGDDSNFVYLVKSGCVKLLKEFENERRNQRNINPNFIRLKKKDDTKQILVNLYLY